MHAVRRTLTAAGITALVALAPGAAWALDAPTSDTPTAGIDQPEAPVVDCGFVAPDQGIAVGEPAPDGSSGTQLAGDDVKPVVDDPGPDPNAPVDPEAEALAAGSGASSDPGDGSVSPDEFCIAALTPGASPLDDVTAGGGTPDVAVPEAAPVSAPAAGGTAAPG